MKKCIFAIFTAVCILASLNVSVFGAGTTEINFENGASGGFADDEKLNVIETYEGKTAYIIKGLTKNTVQLKNFDISMSVNAEISDSDGSYPEIQLRRTDENNYYSVYFNGANGKIYLERTLNGTRTPIGSANADILGNSKKWTEIKISVKNETVSLYYGDMSKEIMTVRDAFPIGSGTVGFKPGEGVFAVAGIKITETAGGIESYKPGEEEVKQEEPTISYGTVYLTADFDDGDKGNWLSSGESKIVDIDGRKAYQVGEYDYVGTGFGWKNYSVEMDIRIDYKEKGKCWPGFYLKKSSANVRYEAYFETSGGGDFCVEHVKGTTKKVVGNGGVNCYADNGKWVHVKFEIIKDEISFYYSDMTKPIMRVNVPDTFYIETGTIGFLKGGSSEVYADNITVKEVTVTEPLQIFTGLKSEAADYESSEYKEDIEKLLALNIMNLSKDGKFIPNAEMTKSDFAIALANIVSGGDNAFSGGRQVFTDVPQSHAAYNAIALLDAYGLIRFDGTEFAPDTPINGTDAIRMLVDMLGYREKAEVSGTGDSGYMNEAISLKLLNGISNMSYSEPILRETAAALISNAVKAEVLKIGKINNDSAEYAKDGDTLLSVYRDIYEFKGRVNANRLGGIGGMRAENGRVIVGETEYKCEKSDIGDRVGEEVRGLYRFSESDDIGAVVWYAVRESDDILKVEADYIQSVSGGIFKYENGSATKSVVLDKNITVFKNGVPQTYSDSLLMPETGSVRLMKVSSGNYDVAMVESYDTYILSRAAAATEMLYLEYESKNISLENADYEIYKNGEVSKLSALKPEDTISVLFSDAKQGKPYYKIYAVSSKAMQTVDGLYESDEWENVILNGKSYRLSDYYLKHKATGKMKGLEVGNKYVFLFDVFGRVSAVKSGGDSKIMLLKNAAYKEGADGCWQLDIFTTDGVWTVLELRGKVNVNGTVYKEHNIPQALEDSGILKDDGTAVRQLVYIEKNKKDEVKKICTAFDTKPLENAVEKAKANKDMDAYIAAKAELEEAKNTNKLVIGSYNNKNAEFLEETTSFGLTTYLDDKTAVFIIPENPSEKSKYYAGGSGGLSGSNYRVTTYNESEFFVAGAVLIDGGNTSGASYQKTSPFYIFDKTRVALDSEGDEVMTLVMHRSGSTVTMQVEKGYESNFAKLRRGDIINIGKNAKGRATQFRAYYQVAQGASGAVGSSTLQQDYAWFRGKVADYDPSTEKIKLVTSSEKIDFSEGTLTDDKCMTIPLQKYSGAYVVDMTNGKIRKASYDDIKTGDFIFIRYCWSSIKDVVIYKGLE